MKSLKITISLIASGVIVLALMVVGLLSYLWRDRQANTPIPVTPVEEIIQAPTPGVQANECLACHIEKQKLIDTAKPEEVVIKESEGTG